MGNNKPTLKTLTGDLFTSIEDGVKKMISPLMDPTGALEPVIEAVGNALFRIVNLQCANKLGKTTIVANIFKNIFWDNDERFFNFPAFKEWPFINDDGLPIKRARIICTAANAAEDGPIATEIKKWWPEGRYERSKSGKNYYSKYVTDTGWHIDIMTYDQDPSEFEGPMISLQWCDEPPKPRLMGAIMSRFSKGGILLLSQTPVNAGPFLDVLEDLKDRGTSVKQIEATIWDNSITDGKENSLGTKRGLMTNEEIEEYIKSIPIDERAARIEGKAVGKSGKIYPTFSMDAHIRQYDLDSPAAKQWNGYCIMDPHDKYYPFILWVAILPPNEIGKIKHVVYNEWPTYDTLGGYYDEKRKSAVCNLTPEDISKIMKVYDGTQYGIEIMKRGIDPRFARNTESNYSKSVEGIILDYQRYDIDFELPDQKLMSTGRDAIRMDLKYDKGQPSHIYNEPDMVFMPHCQNTIRSVNRHYWDDNAKGKEKEAEEFKDPSDCLRMYKALTANAGWKQPRDNNTKKNQHDIITDNIQSEFIQAVSGVGLG